MVGHLLWGERHAAQFRGILHAILYHMRNTMNYTISHAKYYKPYHVVCEIL
jgi:hypothetical protein